MDKRRKRDRGKDMQDMDNTHTIRTQHRFDARSECELRMSLLSSPIFPSLPPSHTHTHTHTPLLYPSHPTTTTTTCLAPVVAVTEGRRCVLEHTMSRPHRLHHAVQRGFALGNLNRGDAERPHVAPVVVRVALHRVVVVVVRGGMKGGKGKRVCVYMCSCVHVCMCTCVNV